jgi:hypothetical protein
MGLLGRSPESLPGFKAPIDPYSGVLVASSTLQTSQEIHPIETSQLEYPSPAGASYGFLELRRCHVGTKFIAVNTDDPAH